MCDLPTFLSCYYYVYIVFYFVDVYVDLYRKVIISRLYTYICSMAEEEGSTTRVAFRSSVSIVSSDNRTSFDVEHRSVDSPKFERKQVRKSTGHPGKNFVLSDDESEEDESEHDEVVSSATTTARSTTPVCALSDGEACGEKKRSKDGKRGSRERSSVNSVDRSEVGGEISNGGMCGCCPCQGDVDSHEVIYEGTVRRESSVGIGNIVEIQDKDSDSNWHDRPRHEDRWQRIRSRVPTGNPKLMKASSEELMDLLDQQNEAMYTSEELDELRKNTKANTNLVPKLPAVRISTP